MGLDVTEEEILAVMNFLPEREIYKVLNIESFVTRAAKHGSYTLGPDIYQLAIEFTFLCNFMSRFF